MRKLLTIALGISLLSGTNAAEPLWRANFAPGGNVLVPHRHFQGAPSADGGSIRFPHENNRIDVKKFPAFDGPVRLSFKVRYLKQGRGRDPIQFIDLRTTTGATFNYFMRPSRISHGVHTSLGASITGSWRTYGDSSFDLGPEAQWHVYTFDFGEHSFASRKNATVIDSGDMALGQPAEFSFHGAYGLELKDLEVTRIPPPPKPAYVEAPTFTLARAEVPFRGEQSFPLADALEASAGGVMFWARPGARVRLLDGRRRMVGAFEVGHAPCSVKAQIVVGAATNTYERKSAISGERADDSWHCAFTWSERGQARLFLNGLPYRTGFDASTPQPLPMDGNRLADARWIVFSGATNGVERLELYRRPVSNRDVLAHYRERMPVDLVIGNSVVPAGAPTPVAVLVAPGGTYMKPNPVEPAEPAPATVNLELRIERIVREYGDKNQPWRVTRRSFEPCGAATRRTALVVDRPMEVATEPATLEPGDYRIVCTLARRGPGAQPYRRSLFFSVAPPPPARGVATTEKWQVAETLFAREFASDGDFDLVEKGPRYFQVVSVPKEAVGQPCLLSVVWPDDRPRSFGLYWYPEGGCGCRDRLQAGIQAGHEIPNSGRLETAEYLVYPAREHSLLEIRTLVEGWDAKVVRVKLERLAGPWPRLTVRLPEGLPARRFGNTDEDQTFYNNFNADVHGSTAAITDEVMRYLDYTGQDRFHYSVARYSYTYGPVEGSCGSGMYPRRQGELDFVVDRFAKGGIGFVGKIALLSTPLFDNLNLIDSDYRARGYTMLDREGLDIRRFGVGNIQPNPANPAVWRLFFDYWGDVIDRNAQSLGDCWYDFGWGYGAWESLKHGYDDWTVAAFVRESADVRRLDAGTRARLRELARPARNSGDYVARWTALASTNAAPAVEAAWLRWRADRVTEFAKALVARCRRRNPALNVIFSTPLGTNAYADCGIDAEALAKVDGFRFATGVAPSEPRFHLHRGWQSGAAQLAKLDAALKRRDDNYLASLRRLRSLRGAADMVTVWGTYFETKCSPPKEVAGHRFGCTFESADAKYHGRYFLKEFAQAVAYGDAQEIVTGGQPVGTLGSEEVTREFVRAYRALPALPFRDLDGYGDREGAAVVGRVRETQNGAYFYFVNVTDRPQSAKSPFWRSLDLSTGERGFRRTIELKPYELRSFLKER